MRSFLALVIFLGLGGAVVVNGGSEGARRMLLVDEFSREDGRSSLGTSWRFVSDGVMGGVSRGRLSRERLDGRSCLRLTGRVSLENNGGFLQAALPLDPDGSLDASGYRGIRLFVRGTGDDYFIHLRTEDTGLPWQHYRASFPTTSEWREVDVPFADFRPESLRRSLDASRLQRIGIVAARKEFDADVAVARICLYR